MRPAGRACRTGPTGAGAEPELAELWLPSWASAERQAGAILLVLGVNNVGRNHPAVERVADGLARTGVAVLVPDSRVLLEGRLEVGEVDGVVRAFQLLAARPEVDRERVGIVGFSVGGSLALLAAGDDADCVAGPLGERASAPSPTPRTYLAAVSAHAYRGSDGSAIPWTPIAAGAARCTCASCSTRSRTTATGASWTPRSATAILAAERPSPDPGLRARSRRTPPDDRPRPADRLEPRRGGDGDRGAAVAARSFIDAISPVRHLGGIEADVHLMHETEDHHVPFVESRVLASALEHGRACSPRTPSSGCSTTCSPTISTSSPRRRSS